MKWLKWKIKCWLGIYDLWNKIDKIEQKNKLEKIRKGDK